MLALAVKGDFIYCENDDEGNEIISIMFEMKNENETTATKHKNEDFFKELDKDRPREEVRIRRVGYTAGSGQRIL